MIRKQILTILSIGAAIAIFQNCSKKETSPGDEVITPPTLPSSPYEYNVSFPAHIQAALVAQDNTPAGNPITNNGATLGRVLFYDTRLSKNNTISCASCHKATAGFSDEAVKSKGFEGGLTRRASMPTLNLRFYKSGKMFWDERANTLEDQVLMPIQDLTEMGMTLSALETKLAGISYYPDLFTKAFGSSQINSDRISKALSQFLRSIVTYQSKYDRVKQGLETFTAQEAQGEAAFLATPPPGPPGAPPPLSCASCHTPPMFITSNPAGPFALNDPTDQGILNQNRFKSSTLRNIAQTAPYFHNGAVPSLQAMLTGGVPAHGQPGPQIAAMLAFMNTLTDNTVNTDVRFSNPFK